MMYYTRIRESREKSVYVARVVSRESKTSEFDTRSSLGYIKG